MPYVKCTFTLDPQDKVILAEAARREGTNISEIVRRSILVRDIIMDAIYRIPAADRGRYSRIAILPEGTDAPAGAEVMRLLVADELPGKLGVFAPIPTRPSDPPIEQFATAITTTTKRRSQ